MKKTSQTHPLRFDAVPAGNGLIGMNFCPGKTQQGAISGDWARDLATDLAAIQGWGATIVVSLLEKFEMDALGVSNLGAEIEKRRLDWMHLPIVDMSIPDEDFEKHWRIAGLILRERLRRGEKILLHCVGGLGRTGMIAGRLLCEFGYSANEAISMVRSARSLGAIQTSAQEAYIHRHARLSPEEQDVHWSRVFGCLIGGMLGDAVGYPLEFVTGTAQDPCGLLQPIQLGVPPDTTVLECSDDTQLTLATALGLAECRTMSEMPARIRAAYIDWYAGQVGAEIISPWLKLHPAMQADRAPGSTCISSLRALYCYRKLPPNDRKGAGALMRIAPIAFLYYALPLRQKLADEAGAMTHQHHTSRMACMTWIVLLDALSHEQTIAEAVNAGLAYSSNYPAGKEIRAAIEKTLELWQTGDCKPVGHLGEGWIAEEALSIAIYANLIGKSLAKVLEMATYHDGDSDTTGSLALQLYGAHHGLCALPWNWVSRLDMLPALLDLPNYSVWETVTEDENTEGISFTYGVSGS